MLATFTTIGANRSDGERGERRIGTMPLYLDHHTHVEGLTEQAIADAHMKDLEAQQKHGVDYIRYWFNEDRGEVFCLVEAPSAEAAHAVHLEAHGLGADEITEVKEGS
jgi:Protein of unknown function (DUF4242)